MIRKLLIANRGEIAVRIMRTAKELGIETVTVYSEVDRDARHVHSADEAYLLGPAAPAQSYLNAPRLLEIADRSGADAVHPGYGFFAENAGFAQAVIDAGLTWIGPHPGAIAAMGEKVRARQTMIAAGVPVVPGGAQPLRSVAEAVRAAHEYGLPLALKASSGGGGKGLKVARTLEAVEEAYTTAAREAQAYFKDPTVYAERYLDNPKHIELQILADRHGTVLHAGERDCSLQRRHQKLWEEAPSAIAPAVVAALRTTGIAAARAIAYDSIGTIEFLVSDDAVYFLEMNTRIQVEHTVSEMVCGLDLVREQIRVASGEPLGYEQAQIDLRGHAIEVRVNAEDPARGFLPVPGTIRTYEEPGGPGVRVDSAARAGWTIPPDYDSLIAKLVVWAPDRAQALARLRRAIDEFVVTGVPTTLPIARALIDHPPVAQSTYGTATLERFAHTFVAAPTEQPAQAVQPATSAGEGEVVRIEVNDRLYVVRLLDAPAQRGTLPPAPRSAPRRGEPPSTGTSKETNTNQIRSPMHGVVVELAVAVGSTVDQGQVVAVIEAMKMMNEIRAPRAGVVAGVHTAAGATVEPQAVLLTFA
ncbi:MAG TPA: acetyl-CoA carboxylase biotin carboxylase subunit [Candidatus Acidoferrales bacterium]|nr:acetyl-CoA carboxylase biotin carboxylase subunit [Candidatus Acidoferrales bacterium]